MAEESGNKELEGQKVSLPDPVLQGLSVGMIMGQSKSKAEEFMTSEDVDLTENVKNTLVLVCQYCKCKVLKPGYGTLVKNKVSLSRNDYDMFIAL